MGSRDKPGRDAPACAKASLPPPSPPRLRAALRSGSAIALARLGNGSILFGIAMAATKWSWKRGSIAVSIFSIWRTTSSISAREARLSSAMRAPVPAALPAGGDMGEIAIGDQAERHRVERIDVAAEGAGQRDALRRAGAAALDQQFRAGVERGLGELDRAHVGLVDEEARLALVQHIGEGAADRLDARRPRGQRAVDHAVLR